MTDSEDVREPVSGKARSQDEQDEQDEQYLQASLSALARMSNGTLMLEEVLTRVAEFAVSAIPHAEGAGVTMIEQGRLDTIVASATFVRAVDAVQYGLGEGPCISAARERRTMRSGSLGGEQRWPRFGPRVGRLGVHSVLSLPLVLPGNSEPAVGAINVYAHPKDAFDDRAQQLGELFAVPAAVAVHNAQVLAQTQRMTEQLQAALTNRAVIDQAIGILISRSGDTADEAFAVLRTISQRDSTKLATVAKKIVDEAARRARARTRPTYS